MIGQRAQPQLAPLEVRFRRLEVSYRWALAVAAIAVVTLVGMVLWTDLGPASTMKADQLATDLTTAWQKNDPALFDRVYASDAVLVSSTGDRYTGLAEIKSLSARTALLGFKPEVIGPVIRSGNTIVAPIKVTMNGQVGYVTSIFQVNDAGLVVHHQDYGEP